MIVRPPDPDVYKHRKHIRAAGGCHKTVANRRFSPKKPGQRMVGPKNRFAQAEGYIHTSLEATGFECLAMRVNFAA